jgi:hypothetical protein
MTGLTRPNGGRQWQRSLAALLLLLPAPVLAQGPRLNLDHLSRLTELGREVVDVTLDGALLGLAAGLLSDKGDEAAIKEQIAGLQGIYVKSFEFDREGAYTDADVQAVRTQLETAGWSRLVRVRDEGETVEIYLWRDSPGGLAIVVAEPTELTVVNILGQIDLAKLSALQGKFGVPRFPVAAAAGQKGQ